MKYFYTLLCAKLLIINLLNAQFSESFSDGEINNNPIWIGETNRFIINSDNRLQLYNLDFGGTSYLSTSCNIINDATWEFFVKFQFNSSSSNYCNIYLVSDEFNLNANVNGYFVKIGNTNDEISLYRQDGSEQVMIINGRDDVINSDSVMVNIRVTRDNLGNWELYSDTSLAGNYELEGAIYDINYFKSEYFGIVCTYTKTRADKFFFDNIEVSGFPFLDSIPPQIITYKVLSRNKLWIEFSEELNEPSIKNNLNYILSSNNQNPDSVTFNIDSLNNIILHFSEKFNYNNSYSLSISSLSDIYNNYIEDTIISFVNLQPEFGHVIVNEIMIDPEPVIGLPNYEYIELYNNTSYIIEISGWNLKVNNKYYTLPLFNIGKMDYAILISNEAENLFSTANSVSLSSFPTLPNTEGSIQLFDNENNIIHFVNYSDKWHENTVKGDGGWSLEMIDPDNLCANADNWASSISKTGGTPGYINSVFNENKDFETPYVDRIGIAGNNCVLLYMNESLNPAMDLDVTDFKVNGDIDFPNTVILNKPEYSILELSFSSLFYNNQEYELSINTRFKDCAGNLSETTPDITFTFPDTPAFNDIVINEILFNPIGDGVDFIELYNSSTKVFDLNKLILATKNIETGEIKQYCSISDESRLFCPNEYYAFTTSAEILNSQYYCEVPEYIIELENMPNFPNDKGRVAIFDIYQNIVDDFEYHENMHFKLLPAIEGVSLERIKPTDLSNNLNNWHSAAETVGYATPGYQNSHFRSKELDKKSFKLVNKVFSPDNDGFEDYIEIQYELNEPGTICTVIIYNTKGRIVKTLADKVILEASGSIYWEGFDEYGNLADIGIYIIYINLYDLKGNVKKYKKTCVLAKKII